MHHCNLLSFFYSVHRFSACLVKTIVRGPKSHCSQNCSSCQVSSNISCREGHCAGTGAWRGSYEPYAPLRHALSESVPEPTDIFKLTHTDTLPSASAPEPTDIFKLTHTDTLLLNDHVSVAHQIKVDCPCAFAPLTHSLYDK